MKKLILTIYCAFIAIIATNAQAKFEWAKQIGDGAYSQFSKADASSGDVYTVGEFYGTVDFNPGAGVFNLSSSNDTVADLFVLKLNSSGSLIWAQKIGDGQLIYGRSIEIDKFGNIYVIGGFEGTADFDPGNGVFNLSSRSNSSSDLFILKLNSSGDFLWANSIGGKFGVHETSISTDEFGNTYTTGDYYDTVDFDPGISVHNLSSIGLANMFILKLDPTGNFLWAKSIKGSRYSVGISIKIDRYSNIYTIGGFGGDVDVDPGINVYQLKTDSFMSSVFILKLDSNGNFLWAKQIENLTENVSPQSMTLDKLSNIYISGFFFGTIDFDPGVGKNNLTSNGDADIFILKLDASGDFKWAKSMGDTNIDYGLSMALDKFDNIYTTGWFRGNVDFDPGPGKFELTTSGSSSLFVLKLTNSGEFEWAYNFEGGDNTSGISISLDSSSNIYTLGSFHGKVDFDPGVGVYSLTADAGTNIFLHKMSQNFGSFINSNTINNLRIYPNPSTGKFTIENSKNINSIKVYNVLGEMIYNQSDIEQTGSYEIDLSAFGKGIYFIIINDEVAIESKKIVIE